MGQCFGRLVSVSRSAISRLLRATMNSAGLQCRSRRHEKATIHGHFAVQTGMTGEWIIRAIALPFLAHPDAIGAS